MIMAILSANPVWLDEMDQTWSATGGDCGKAAPMKATLCVKV
jgi:hypothetical protein